MDFNQVIITGYVAGEYNVKEITKNDKKQNVLNGVILVNGANDKTTPIKIAAWNKEAKVLNEKTVKGSHVMIVGQWNVNQYEKDGRTIYDNYLLVKEIKFMESKEEYEKKKDKLETQKDPFGNIAAGKDTINEMSDFDEDDMPF
ncbi:hypothetical protein BU064_14405 [Staphylococcus succinus]|nr:hypothetical protein BU064_14405 [Staphylococcus succinus]RIM48185.1 hypothetical protein BUY22_02370 [Staphylococcus cohnii]